MLVYQEPEASPMFYQPDMSPPRHVISLSSSQTDDSSPIVPTPSCSALQELKPLEKCDWYWAGISM